MPSQKGFSLPVVLVIVVIVLGIGYYLYSNQTKQTPTVELKEEYTNPFDSENSYQNPFETSDNPFANLE